jgi:iron complex transport system ATP-binding protein
MFNLEIQNISLGYNHRLVVKGLSFRLQPGEMLGLCGPNGCGKSSIIKAVSRVLSLRSGKITLDGKEIALIARGELARLTVAEVVLLGRNPHLGLLRGESSRDLAIARWAMERTGIVALAERRLGELSGGERQRVTIARVLAQEPGAILLDEPTANLDISHQLEILDLIKGLCREKNLAVLIAIHDLNLAAQYCDRLLLIKEGQIYAEGTPDQVVTSANIKAVYGTKSFIYPHPENNLPVVLLSHNHKIPEKDRTKEN